MTNPYYPHLFAKGKIGSVTLKNRIVRNSMGTYLGNPDGTVTDRQIKAYAEAAEGGAGLIPGTDDFLRSAGRQGRVYCRTDFAG